MSNLFRNIYLVFKFGPEINEFAQKLRSKRLKDEAAEALHHLTLCKKHAQEPYHSHYSENNCDYCILLKRLEN